MSAVMLVPVPSAHAGVHMVLHRCSGLSQTPASTLEDCGCQVPVRAVSVDELPGIESATNTGTIQAHNNRITVVRLVLCCRVKVNFLRSDWITREPFRAARRECTGSRFITRPPQ